VHSAPGRRKERPEAARPDDDGAARGGEARGSVDRVGGEEGLAIAGGRNWGTLAVHGAEVGRAEGGVVPGAAAARGVAGGEGPVLRVAVVGEGR